MSVYQVEEDGTLSSLDDLFFEEDMPHIEEELQQMDSVNAHLG